jgi:tetratricopeptide (TPR) repeat protein
MDVQQSIASIKQFAAKGELEEALAALVTLLDSEERFAELAQAARVNQADYYQLKSQVIKGTVSSDDARLATNQITDNVLDLVRRVETGRLSLEAAPPHRRQAWRYYAAGGAVALVLAALGWYFFGPGFGQDDPCPKFKRDYPLKVMILPFRKSGLKPILTPEIDLAVKLTSLINRTSGLRDQAIVDVNEKYDTQANNPNPDEAIDQAEQCDAQMVVWGTLNQDTENRYKVNLFYRLLGANEVLTGGDTSISNLFKVTDAGNVTVGNESNWEDHLVTLSELLFVVMANQQHASIPAGLFPEPLANRLLDTGTVAGIPVDTLNGLVMADYYAQQGQNEKARQELDKILAAYPGHQQALQKRGTLFLNQKEYTAAADDLEAAAPEPEKASAELLKAQTEAYIKSRQPEKAEKRLKMIRSRDPKTGAWYDSKVKETQDTALAVQADLQKAEVLANARPGDSKAQVRAAKANLADSNPDEAIKHANLALKSNPGSVDAYVTKIRAYREKNDTTKVEQTVRQAIKAGVTAKEIVQEVPVVAPLLDRPRRRQ